MSDRNGYEYYPSGFSGSQKRCANTCYAWYILDTEPIYTTEYRYRSVSTTYYFYKYGSWSEFSDTSATESDSRDVDTHTQYRYRDRESTPVYHFYRWGDWSAWSTDEVSENSSRKVEREDYYRYQDKILETTYCFERWSDWSDYTTAEAVETEELKVQTKKQYCYRSKTEGELRNPYTDLKTDASYFDAVIWVTEKGIMNGTSATEFNTEGTITRGQMVTILWRAAGKPAPTKTECSFKDVPADSPFRDAVLWATENGIAGGESADQFGVDSVCRRGHTITFLYRTAGEPDVVLSQEPFEDVVPEDFFYKAVLWAYANDISSGISTTEFGINADCTRTQVAVMLYRAFAES